MATNRTTEDHRDLIVELMGGFLAIFEREVRKQTRDEAAADLRAAATRHPVGTARREAFLEAARIVEAPSASTSA